MISLTDSELLRVRSAIQDDPRAADLYVALSRRSDHHIESADVVSAHDSMDWWHVVWERLSDVAIRQRLDPSNAHAAWLRKQTLETCARPLDDWIGPFFRQRTSPPRGMLETAHIGLAISHAMGLCPELFTTDEHEYIAEALLDKCQTLCRRFLDQAVDGQRHPDAAADRASTGRRLNNWFIVLLNGYGTSAVLRRDDDAIRDTVQFYAEAVRLYNQDSYGESLQYWNYASSQLSHLYEVLVRAKPELAAELDLACYTRCIPWVVQSFLYRKPLAGWGAESYPRALNFGDSTALFRPTADLLLHIASRAKVQHPSEAGLAAWLFEQTFATPDLEPRDRDTFGFFNQFKWPSLVSLPDAAPPLSPESAGLPLTQAFECGSVVIRDKWTDPATILGLQSGYDPLRVASHRHRDQNSFILAHRRERIFADPGHCCYRLETQRASTATDAHSTWTFLTEDGNVLDQQLAAGSVDTPPPPLNRRTGVLDRDGLQLISSDTAAAYGWPIRFAERTWLTALPHVVLIIDRIEADEPVRVRSHFVLNNRDNLLRVNVATDTRLVLRRGDAAAKFFQLRSTADGAEGSSELSRSWGYIHDIYHPQPNQPGQGREGSADIRIFTSAGYANRHMNVYAIVLDADEHIRGWHVDPTDGQTFQIRPPTGPGYLFRATEPDRIELTDIERDIRLTTNDS